MSCSMYHRREYRGGLVAEGTSVIHHHSAQERIDQRVARLKERGIPHTVDGLSLTYDNVQGLPEDLCSTVTLTWTDRPEESR